MFSSLKSAMPQKRSQNLLRRPDRPFLILCDCPAVNNFSFSSTLQYRGYRSGHTMYIFQNEATKNHSGDSFPVNNLHLSLFSVWHGPHFVGTHPNIDCRSNNRTLITNLTTFQYRNFFSFLSPLY